MARRARVQDWLSTDSPGQEERLAENEEADNRRQLLREAMDVHNDRERRIFEARRLADDPITLEISPPSSASAASGSARSRSRAFEKVQKAVKKGAR